MFYTEAILRPKEPLAKVWLAAHMERKLTKAQLVDTDLSNPINAIIGIDQPPMALRLSGQLLLGVVRIYSRKTKYLLEDCNEALIKIKMAFRPGLVDLPHDQVVSSVNAITLPDVLNQFDILLPEPEFNLKGWDFSQGFDRNVSRPYDITILDSRSHDSPMMLHPTDDFLLGGDDNIDLGLGLELDPALFTPHSMSGMTPGDMEVEVGRDASTMATPGAFDQGEISHLDPSKVLDMPDDFNMPETPFGIDPNLENQMAGLNITEQPGDVPIARTTQPKNLKRKVVFDDITQLTQEQIRSQINDPSSIVEAADFIPIFKKPHQLWNWEKSAVSYYLDFSAPLNLVPHQKEQFQAATSSFNMSAIASNLDNLLAPTPGFGGIGSPMHFQIDDGMRHFDGPSSFNVSKLFGMAMDDTEIDTAEPVPSSPAQANQIRLGRSTLKARELLRNEMSSSRRANQQCTFSTIAGPEKVARRDAVKFFFETLVLRTKNLVDVKQDKPYGEIIITPKDAFFNDDVVVPVSTPAVPTTV